MRKYPKKIIGKKAVIRKLEPKDLAQSLAWLKDPQVNKFLSQDFSGFDLKQENQWYQFIQSSHNDMAFAIDTQTGKYIGNCALHKINWIKKIAEFGIVIGDKQYWNQGYGTDAVKLVLQYATHDLGLRKIELNVYNYNGRAIKTYLKCGFKHKEVLKKDHYYNGRYWDTYVMEYVKHKKEEKDV